MSWTLAIWVLAWSIATPVTCWVRRWADATGKYKMEADLVAFNAATVVLKKGGRELVEVPAKKLSKEDQEYLKSKEAEMVSLRAADQVQTWTLSPTPDYSWPHTNQNRKRLWRNHLPSLALRVNVRRCATRIPVP